LDEANGGWDSMDNHRTRFFYKGKLKATDIITSIYPGFMTDWQAPWSLLMTQAYGTSNICETIYEDRFGYVNELKKMGAVVEFFNPKVTNPSRYYNFNLSDRSEGSFHAIKTHGPVSLHNAILEVSDLRAGATIVLAASIATGKSVVMGIEHIDRGYEKIEERLKSLGVKIKRMKG
jgi:UDP-N-acetylglucosamine 1-carboxyvinyltransferase